jgi:hypothetical protein
MRPNLEYQLLPSVLDLFVAAEEDAEDRGVRERGVGEVDNDAATIGDRYGKMGLEVGGCRHVVVTNQLQHDQAVSRICNPDSECNTIVPLFLTPRL